MSFFKRFLPGSDELPDPWETLDRDGPHAQFALNGERGPCVTLSQVREALCDPNDECDPYEPAAENQVAKVIKAPGFDICPSANTVEDILHATRDFLEDQILAEQDCIDLRPEFPFEKLLPHPKGNDLPQFSTAEELRDASHGSDFTIPLRHLGMTVDKDMMQRIRAGQGPRPFQAEDLVGRLRLEPKHGSQTDMNMYIGETYDELLAVIRAWNTRIATKPDSTHVRKELIEALESRCQLIEEVEQGRQSETVLEQHYLRLRQTLHAYRSALTTFEDQNIINQLIILLANQGIAIPDLDAGVRDRIVEVLFREYRSRIYLGEEHSARRDRLRVETRRAKLQEDDTELQELARQRRQLDKDSCNQASEEVRSAIKTARKRLCDKVLGELQSLTEQQAGQKWAACGLAKTPASALAQNCIESGNAMDSMLQEWDLNIDNTLRSAIERLRKMKRLGNDNNGLVQKLAGLDVPIAERKAVMERRRNDARTPYIMMEIANQSSQLQEMPQRVLGQMDNLDDSLNWVLDSARANSNAHDTLLTRVDEDDPYCIDEAAYVVTDSQAQASNGGEVVKAASIIVDEGTTSGRAEHMESMVYNYSVVLI